MLLYLMTMTNKILIDIVEEKHVHFRLLKCTRCGENVEKVLEDIHDTVQEVEDATVLIVARA